MARGLVIVAVALGCGRFGFDARRSEDAAATDAAPNIQRVQVLAPGYGSAAQMSTTIQQTAGDLLIAATYWDESPDTITLTDTLGNAWTSLPIEGIPSVCGGPTGNATGEQLWYAAIATTGSNMVTVSQTSGTQPLGLFLLEYSGVAGLDASSGRVAPAPSNAVSAPALVTTGTDLIVAFFTDTIATGTCGGGATYTVLARDPGFPNFIEDAIGPAGTYTPNGTLPTSQSNACWVASAVAFHAR